MKSKAVARCGAAVALGVGLTAAAFLACTFTQSLDYLQAGDGDGGGDRAMDPDMGIVVPEAGVDATVLVPSQTKPGLLAQDDASLFWVSAKGVFSVAKSGGAPKMLGSAPGATWISVDADPNGSVFLAVGVTVVRLAKDGSGGGPVFTQEAGAGPIGVVVPDPAFLYVLREDDVDGTGAAIFRMSRDGGGAVTLAGTTDPMLMAVGAQNLTWLDFVADPSSFYELPKNAAAGTTPKALPLKADDETPPGAESFAVDDASLYWSTDINAATTGLFTRSHESVGSVITLYRAPPGTMDSYGAIAVDATSIYMIEKHEGKVLRVGKSTGTADTLLTKLAGPGSLVVDGTSVYVTVENTGDNGVVLKLPK